MSAERVAETIQEASRPDLRGETFGRRDAGDMAGFAAHLEAGRSAQPEGRATSLPDAGGFARDRVTTLIEQAIAESPPLRDGQITVRLANARGMSATDSSPATGTGNASSNAAGSSATTSGVGNAGAGSFGVVGSGLTIAHELRIARDAEGLVDVLIRVSSAESRALLMEHGAQLAGRLHALGLSLRSLNIQISAPPSGEAPGRPPRGEPSGRPTPGRRPSPREEAGQGDGTGRTGRAVDRIRRETS